MRKYRVNWDGRSNYIAKVFEDFLTNPAAKTLFDVKLIAEGRNILAHRLVLSACSSYFEEIFCAESDRQAVICMPGVSFELLKAMILFIYRGEIIMSEDRYAAFMTLAKSLGIKSLNNDTQQCARTSPTESPPIPRKLPKSAIVHVPEGKGIPALAADVRNVAQPPKERKSFSRAIEIQSGLPNRQPALKWPRVSFSTEHADQSNNLVVNEQKAYFSRIHEECLGKPVDCLEVPGNSDSFTSESPDDACHELKELYKSDLHGQLSCYKCVSCAKAFTTSVGLEQHVQSMCPPPPLVDNFGSSSVTVSEGNSATSLGCVGAGSIYGNPIPGRVLQSATNLLDGQKTNIISQPRPRRSCARASTSENKFRCTHCDRTFWTKVSLTNHLPKCPYPDQAKSVTPSKANGEARAV